jgi:ABC-type dipeptide/oligopeptide/nickel transport system permease subunit
MTSQARTGLVLSLALVSLAIVGPIVAADPVAQPDLLNGAFLLPSAAHWLGTDQLSRDIFARLAYGARISLTIAIIAVTVAAVAGAAIGLAAGSSTGIVGRTLQRVINLGLALPRIIVLLVVLAAVGRIAPPLLGIVLGLTGWPAVARLVRGETLRLVNVPYVAAARALGARHGRVLLREIFPGTLPALLVATTLGLADAILLEAGLSFIGVGVRPPDPSWGGMILEARDHLANAPWLLLAPCLALGLATSAATLLGEAFRRSLQPDTR